MNWPAPFLALAVCSLVLAWLLRRDRLPMDHPNDRSLHATPTPRVGGLGIMAGVGAAAALSADIPLLAPLIGAFVLAGLSLLDDVRGLPVAMRFSVHLLVAASCLLAMDLHGWALLAGTLAVVWMTNLYNFMDGADGLAGGMTLIGFGALALVAWLSGAAALAALCAAIAAAALAFLRLNFPPARIFMGDAGSISLGFLAATLGLWGVLHNVWPWAFPVLVFSPFIVDASVTLAQRGLRGEKVWQAHRSHYYQRVVLLGASHRQLAIGAYVLMFVSAGLAFLLLWLPQQTPWVVTLWALVNSLVFLAVDLRWRRHREAS